MNIIIYINMLKKFLKKRITTENAINLIDLVL